MEIAGLVIAILGLGVGIVALLVGVKATRENKAMRAYIAKLEEREKSPLIEQTRALEEVSRDNYDKIVSKAESIAGDEPINIGDYTKTDTMNVYIEHAKKVRDEYMQEVWARVLACEMKHEGTFSKMTLMHLSMMTREDYTLFERLARLVYDNALILGNSDIDTDSLIEQGLLVGNRVERSIAFENGMDELHFNDDYFLRLKTKENISHIDYTVTMLTRVGIELMNVVDGTCDREMAIYFARSLREQLTKKNIMVSLCHYTGKTFEGIREMERISLD